MGREGGPKEERELWRREEWAYLALQRRDDLEGLGDLWGQEQI